MTDARLDHAVIYIGRSMEDAHALFTALGFSLTPRGFQSLGSINHLAMFSTDYLEIVGLPSDGTGSRPDLDDAPIGINGLVFKSADAQETYAHLQSVGIAGGEPVAASRPVDLDGETKTASFRNINVRPGAFDGGRVYFCEHRTPELVWRPEYLQHANSVSAISQFTIVAQDPAAVAGDYARMLDCDAAHATESSSVETADMELLVMTAAAYGERFGGLASPLGNRDTIFGAIRFRTPDLTALKSRLDALTPSLPTQANAQSVAVRLPLFDTVLEFTA